LHISLLIDMGLSAGAIANRVGHESIDITCNYLRLFPKRQAERADRLNFERTGKGVCVCRFYELGGAHDWSNLSMTLVCS